MSDELPPDLVRDARRGRGRSPAQGQRGLGEPRQPRVPLYPRQRVARDHRERAAAAPSPRPIPPRRRRLARGLLGRSPRPDRRPHARRRPGGGRDLVRPRPLRQRLRHPHPRAAPTPLRECLRLPVVEPHDDLLGARRLRGRPHRGAGDEHQGRHGGPRGAHPPVGRQPGEPAEYRAPPRGGEAPRGAHRHHRRERDRGGGAVRRGAPAPSRDRRGAGSRNDARHRRRGALRPRVRRPSHGRLRPPRRSRPGTYARVGCSRRVSPSSASGRWRGATRRPGRP